MQKINPVIHTNASKRTVISSLIWKFLERGGTQGVQFFIQIALARILAPEDYGVLAIFMAFIAVSNVFVQSGFNTALIQKEDADEIDFSSVFWISLFVAAVIYIVLFFTAPFIAEFYKNENLTLCFRVLSLTLFFGALNSVQNAMISKTMQFKRFFFSSMGGILGSGIVGIILAYRGFGVWSLIVQQLANNFLISAILWVTVKWRPHFFISLRKIKSLFSFGWKILVSNLLAVFVQRVYSLAIGRVYSSSDLGFFSRGEQFPTTIATNLDGSIQSVMLPALSSHNQNRDDVKRIMRRSITTSCFFLFPCMLGMAAVAKNLVLILLTEKWLPCVPFLQLSCLYFAIWPVHTANLTAINAIGRSDIYLKLEVIKQIIGISVLFITLKYNLYAIAVGRVVFGFIAAFINAYPNKRLLNYSYFEQLMDIVPAALISFVMAIVVYLIGNISFPVILILLFQISAGIFIYALFSKVFHLEAFDYMAKTLKEFKSNRI